MLMGTRMALLMGILIKVMVGRPADRLERLDEDGRRRWTATIMNR